ncbi:MAG: hypothetical protein JOZ78_27480 [Chroococcidiopsidaceae cyanobacterium CP_BM_ER_R8_30]|nr:hypothetical protein [Chroococcidiopsidaceae cyanobacterium CP_BM_ER_R8_30]
MWTDEILEEIHKIREEYAKSLNYDLNAIFADLRKKQAESGREVVNLSRKRNLTTRWRGRVRDLDGEARNASRST